MKALILAAGRGSRLGNITAAQPKGLTKVLGVPIINRQLETLKRANISEVAAATGYLREQIVPFVGNQFVNENWANSNMVRSLLCCQSYLKRSVTIVSYSDIIYASETVEALCEVPGEIVISYDPHWLTQWKQRFEDPLDDAESFVLNVNGSLKEIGQVANSIAAIQGQYMGLIKITPKGFQTILDLLNDLSESDIDSLDMTALLNMLLKQGVEIQVFANQHFWFEIDNQKDLAICEQLLSSTARI